MATAEQLTQPPPPPNCMKILLEMAQDKGGTCPQPFYKADGQRFASGDTTLKLVQGAQYKLSFVCSPPSILSRAEIVVTASLNEPQDLPLTSIQEEALGISTHSSDWTCHLDTCKKNSRHVLEVHLYIEEFGMMTLPLQFKVYNPGEKNLVHGNRLRYLQFLFKSKSDNMSLFSMVPFSA